MKIDAKVYRGGSGQRTIYQKPYTVDLDNEKQETLDIRIKTNPNGERKSTFCVEFGPDSYPVILEMIAQNIAATHLTHASILKVIANDLQSQNKKS